MCRKLFSLFLVIPFVLTGCMDDVFEQAKKKSPNTIIGKTTSEIEKFDPKANIEISDSKVRITNPVTGALEAYGPILSGHFKLVVQQAIEMFRATHGRYPKDYEEFNRVVVKQGQIRLPVLPGNWKYSYDEVDHDIKIIRHLGGKKANEKNKEVDNQQKAENPKQDKNAKAKKSQSPAINSIPSLKGIRGVR